MIQTKLHEMRGEMVTRDTVDEVFEIIIEESVLITENENGLDGRSNRGVDTESKQGHL